MRLPDPALGDRGVTRKNASRTGRKETTQKNVSFRDANGTAKERETKMWGEALFEERHTEGLHKQSRRTIYHPDLNTRLRAHRDVGKDSAKTRES